MTEVMVLWCTCETGDLIPTGERLIDMEDVSVCTTVLNP